jgi:trans-2,3-dihydro-3-hydroxyanthranilate isomerase
VPSTFRFNIVDVFTDTPLTGNQLAVFTDAREIPEHMLQLLAKEIGFSETVFVYPAGGDPHPAATPRPQAETAEAGDPRKTDETVFVYPPAGEGHVRIRIFTPGIEVPFAGHPVLGSAFVLAGPLQLGEIRLETGNGVVPVRLERDGARIVFGRMEQPVPTVAAYEEEAELLDAIGVERSELPVEVYDNGLHHVFVVLGSEEEVAGLRPDLARLAAVGEVLGINCVAGAGTRWKTRMFIPSGGIAEDPATGSAAGPLALHLARHGRIAFGEEIEITQGVEIQRPSKLYARVDGSADRIERVEVGGSAVVVARGEFRL